MQIPILGANLRTLAHLLAVFSILAGSLPLWASPSPNTQFTVEVLSPNSATIPLIETNASWRYFKGMGNPNEGWDTADDSRLGAAWGTGAAGFGYGDGDDQTVLGDMQNGYSTLYLRKTFSHGRVLDPRRLKLRIDYDDGFVAYLDGREFARVNAPGEPGQRPAFNSVASASHEASRGPAGHRMETWYFAPDFPALFPHASEGGDLVPHVLAIQGLNRGLGDDDFSLIPSLHLEKFFTEVATSSVELAGRINLLGATAVLVNGEAAVLNSLAGTWSKTGALRPGLNRLIIEARDCDGHTLSSLTKDVLTKGTPRFVAGTLSSDTSWDSEAGVVELTGNVAVAAGVTLTIGQGTTVLFRPGTSLRSTSGTINVNGTARRPVHFLPADGETPWDGFAVGGVNSSLSLRFAEVVAGKFHLSDNANALLEDTIFRDYSYTADGFEDYLGYALGNCLLTARRSVFSRYYTMAFGGRSTLRMEDCLFESSEHDFFKPQDTPSDSYVRRCTFAHSSVAGTDGVDTSGADFTVENCLFYDIPDKAISVEASTMTIRNCLMHNVGTGVAVKDDSTAMLVNNTIAHSTYGIAVYLKNAGASFARAAVTNNIVWANSNNIALRNPDDGSTSPNATIAIRNSDIAGGYTGAGNISGDPRFIMPINGDYRLATGSPALGTGVGGVNMGAPFPAGSSQPPAVFLHPLSQTTALSSNTVLRAAAVGGLPLFYQWRFNGADLPWGTSSTLVLTNLTAEREGHYQVLVSNASGSANSAPALVMLGNPVRIGYGDGDCRFRLRLTGPAGRTFILQTSSDLVSWISVVTNIASTGILELPEAGLPTDPVRFFRAASIP